MTPLIEGSNQPFDAEAGADDDGSEPAPVIDAASTMTRRAKQPTKTPLSLSSPRAINIPLYRNSDLSYKRNTLARDKGRIAIVTNRGLGCDGRDGVGREWSLQGGFGRALWPSRARHAVDSVFAWLRA